MARACLSACEAAVFSAGLLVISAGAIAQPLRIEGDGVPAPLGAEAGDPARGRAIVVDRQKGLCLLCHTGPFPDQKFQGDLAPDLAGAGSRLSLAQIRLRLADSLSLNPQSIMPAYFKTEGLNRVGKNWMGRPILSGQEIEDVAAFIATLKDPSVKGETK